MTEEPAALPIVCKIVSRLKLPGLYFVTSYQGACSLPSLVSRKSLDPILLALPSADIDSPKACTYLLAVSFKDLPKPSNTWFSNFSPALSNPNPTVEPTIDVNPCTIAVPTSLKSPRIFHLSGSVNPSYCWGTPCTSKLGSSKGGTATGRDCCTGCSARSTLNCSSRSILFAASDISSGVPPASKAFCTSMPYLRNLSLSSSVKL